jgi:hypothetical protein
MHDVLCHFHKYTKAAVDQAMGILFLQTFQKPLPAGHNAVHAANPLEPKNQWLPSSGQGMKA